MNSKKTIKVDYHFHPNLPYNETRAAKKIGRIYQKFRESGIDAVIITEHAYKDYIRAFELMEKYKPKEFSIFPGLEYITKESIDICLFGKDSSIYNHNFKPFELSYDEIINLLEIQSSLFGFVTHPFTLGTTSIINKKGTEYAKKAIHALGAVEASYTVYRPLKNLLNTSGLSYVLKNLSLRIDHNENLPRELHPKNVKFLAAGSDAHHTWKIGNHAKVKLIENNIFKSIISNKKLHSIEVITKVNIFLTMINLITSFREYCIKVKFKLWNP